MFFDKISTFLSSAAQSAGSLLKVTLLSGKASPRGEKKSRSIVVMGNGPSLRATIDEEGEWLLSNELMAVNFAANTPDFRTLRPAYYVIADAYFFHGSDSDTNLKRLWDSLASVDWDLNLWIPRRYRKAALNLVGNNECIRIKYFNLTPLEGWKWLIYPLMDASLGMPRPRNVMIPAIFCAISEGYSRIYLAGADHSWTRTLSVDDENFVVSIQPHFYEDNEKEHARVRSTYAGLHLHDVLGSMTVAFRSYWEIAGYAASRGVEIINVTPGSMIDAFPRFRPVALRHTPRERDSRIQDD